MEPELFSQAGMELSCQRFNQRINSETDQRGIAFNGFIHTRYESCDYEKKMLLLSVIAEPIMRNPSGVMHGGAMASAMDIAMGSLGFYMSGEYLTPTINLNVSYERPIAIGKRVFIETVCHSCGRTMAYLSTRAWVEGVPDKIVATASGTYYTAGGER